jgi:hypothetical protein
MKTLATPILQKPLPKYWTDYLKKLLILILFLGFTRIAMIGDQELLVKFGWVILVSLIVFACEDILVLWCFLSLFVIFPSSIWYLDGDFGYLFRKYVLLENEIYNFKPNEIFLIIFSIKIFAKGIFPSTRLKFPNTPLNRSFLVFFIAILIGFIVGIQNEHPIRAIFIASEFRILIEGFIFFYIAYYCINNYRKLKDTVQIFIYIIGLKGIIAILEAVDLIPKTFYTSGYSISTYTSVVSGVHDLNLFVFAILILSSFISFSSDEKLSYLINQKFLLIICLFFTGIVILSFRRTNYVMLLAGLSLLIVKLSLRRFIILFVSLLFLGFSLALLFNIADLDKYPIFKFIQLRFSPFNSLGQYEQVIASNNAHIRDFILGIDFIMENTLWGLGVGSRFYADRTMVYETSFIHNGILHSWVKFGLFGAVAYVLFYYYSIKACIRNRNPLITRHWIPLGIFSFIISNLISELFMPPFFQNFQKTSLIFLSLSLVLRFHDLADTQLNLINYKTQSRELKRQFGAPKNINYYTLP